MKAILKSKKFYFRNTKHNGALAGTEVVCDVPEFNWDEFIALPNAKEFVRRHYDSTVQKLVREVGLGELNGTSSRHLSSLESIVNRSISFKKSDIQNWIDTRDWSSLERQISEEGIQGLKRNLPEFAINDHVYGTEPLRLRVWDIIAGLADPNWDPIAVYLTEKLGAPLEEYDAFVSSPVKWTTLK